jgi:hypothetical protein
VDTILEQQRLGIDIKKRHQQQQEGEANDALCSLHDCIHHSQALKQQKNSRNNAVKERRHLRVLVALGLALELALLKIFDQSVRIRQLTRMQL